MTGYERETARPVLRLRWEVVFALAAAIACIAVLAAFGAQP